MELLTFVFGIIIYVVLGLIALWGFFCVVLLWRRLAEKNFRSEKEQDAFLAELERPLAQGDFHTAAQICVGDPRAMPQLAELALAHRRIGYVKVRQMVLDRFQRDVLSDMEYRLSWVYTVIKSAPMVGLLGTVIGMMGAFGKLAGKNVDVNSFAGDIMLALVTTACGLAIAIPLVLCAASLNVSIRKMEDLVAAGLTQFLEMFRTAGGAASKQAG